MNLENAVRYEERLVRRDYDFTLTPLPAGVASCNGMLAIEERRLLFHIAKHRYTGEGAIIDAGSFFGSALVSLATGLTENKDFDRIFNDSPLANHKLIHAYELGYLPAPNRKDAKPVVRKFGDVEYVHGESFVPILEKNAEPFKHLVNLHIGDLLSQNWPDLPIEVCFLDVCKTARLNAHATRTFFPHFVAGKTILINQDFFFDRLPWIKVTMGYLSEYFEWIGQVFSSSVYVCKKAIPREIAEFDPFSSADTEKLFEYHNKHPREHLSVARLFLMDLSYAYLLALRGEKEKSLREIERIRIEYADYVQAQDEKRAASTPEGQKVRGATHKLHRAMTQIETGRLADLS